MTTTTTMTVTRKGEVIEFSPAFDTTAAAVQFLEGQPDAGGSFAADLCRKFHRYGASPKQAAWIQYLATQPTSEQAKPAATVPALDLSSVVEMMTRAADAQKRQPRIQLEVNSQPVVLALAGNRARIPGSVNITDGRGYGRNVWFGRILPDGAVQPSRSWDDDVEQLLRSLADDPARVASQHGVATGCCCFCGLDLSTAESRSVGYGPVCAGKYGLPWGDTAKADADNNEGIGAGKMFLFPDGNDAA